jgi:hypothetical protein
VGQDLSVTASGTVSDTDKLAVTGTTAISAPGQTVELDTATNDFTGAVTVTGGATTLKDANSLTVSLTTSGSTDLTAVGPLTLDGTVSGATSNLTTNSESTSFGTTTVDGYLSTTAKNAVTDSGTVKITGATKVDAGTDIVLDTETNEFGELALVAGSEIAIRETGAISGTAVSESLQAEATTGIDLKSGTQIKNFAAKSAEGEIKVRNTGGLTIAPVSDFNKHLDLSGVKLAGGANNKIDILTQSPITINAPIENGTTGLIILVAQGDLDTDDITINSTITGDAVEVYAGDSIELSATASLQIKDIANNYGYSSQQVIDASAALDYGTTKLYYGTNFDPDTEVSSVGYASASVVISDYATIESIVDVTEVSTIKLVIYGPTRRLLYVTPDQNHDYFNALDPTVEISSQWNQASVGNILITNDLSGSFLYSEKDGSIVIEEIEDE